MTLQRSAESVCALMWVPIGAWLAWVGTAKGLAARLQGHLSTTCVG